MKTAPIVVDDTCATCNREGKGTYVLAAKCDNCGWTGEIRCSLGHDALGNSREPCPVCECRRVRYGRFIGRDDAAPTSKEQTPKENAP